MILDFSPKQYKVFQFNSSTKFTLRNMKRLREIRGCWEGVMKEWAIHKFEPDKQTYRWASMFMRLWLMLPIYLGFWKRSQWLNYDACNFFSVQCALLNMFLVDLLRSAMLSLNMSTCSIWVAGRAKVHKRIRSVASERVCKLSALYHEASNSAISYVTGPFTKGVQGFIQMKTCKDK